MNNPVPKKCQMYAFCLLPMDAVMGLEKGGEKRDNIVHI